MASGRRPLGFTGSPSRLPDDAVEVEPVAGDLQLTRPRRPGTERPAPKRRTLYAPYELVPFSGVYDVVDEEGNYLESQTTCHEGKRFPPSTNPKALEALHRVHPDLSSVADSDEQPPRRPFGYGYMLAYKALHLQPEEADRNIYRPKETVRRSGVYNVVGFDGEYLSCQRACVKGERFPLTKGLDPGTYGYQLEYEAQRLTGE
jgi:hypothetical protein